MARILWNPRQENRFVVGTGTRLTLYELASEHSEIRQVMAQTDLQLMKVSLSSNQPWVIILCKPTLSSALLGPHSKQMTSSQWDSVLERWT